MSDKKDNSVKKKSLEDLLKEELNKVANDERAEISSEETCSLEFEKDFKVVGEEEVKFWTGKNLLDDLKNLGFLDRDNLSEEEKKFYKEILGNQERDGDWDSGWLYKV